MPNILGFYTVLNMNSNFPVPTRWEVFETLREIPNFEIIIVSLQKIRNPRSPHSTLERFFLFVKSCELVSTRAVLDYTLDKYFSSKHVFTK
jgi:hypothetical protein